MRLVHATVTAVLAEEPGIQRLTVETPPDVAEAAGAICYPSLTGACGPGDVVVLNITAVELGLGTGGWHFVVAREGRDLDEPSGGHVMKLRYTPLQTDVLAIEEEASAHRETMRDAEDLEGMPVVCCGLHSQVAAVAAAVREGMPEARVAYVMTDAASLPLWLSDSVRAMRSAGLLDVTVSTGQAFGGELEAVTLHSGLLAARHVAEADVAVVANGPGVTGTDSPFGHGGVAQAEAINAAAAIGGRPIAVLRMSFADPRPRHRGVSHHSLAVLARLALAPAVVPVPPLPSEQAAEVDRALEDAGVWGRHVREEVDRSRLPDTRGVKLGSMGRGARDDHALFAAAAAAGDAAVRMLSR